MRIMTLLSTILLFNIASAQNSITGFVYDPLGIPLDSISIIGDFDQPESTMTDSAGFYQFQFELDYVVGDVNGSDSYNGLDITYGVSFFKGGPAPVFEYECTPGNTWFISADVNASCSYNGLDITYGVSFFKGGPLPGPCPDCPSETADTSGILITVKDPLGMYNTNKQRAAFGDTLEHILINVDTTQGGFDMNSFLMLQFEYDNKSSRFKLPRDGPGNEAPTIWHDTETFNQQQLDSLYQAIVRDSSAFKLFNYGTGSHWKLDKLTEGDVLTAPDSNNIVVYENPNIPDLGLNMTFGYGYQVRLGVVILNAGYDLIETYHEELWDAVFLFEQEENIPAESVNDPTDIIDYITPWDIIRAERINNHDIETQFYWSDSLGWVADETITDPRNNKQSAADYYKSNEFLNEIKRINKNKNMEWADQEKGLWVSYSKNMPRSEIEKIKEKYFNQ